MALKDIADEELLAIMEQQFAESKAGIWGDFEEISLAAVRDALNRSYTRISKLQTDSQAIIGEILSQGIMTKITPNELQKQIVELADDGTLQLKTLRKNNGVMMSIEQWAQVTARTELFGIYEDTKVNLSMELMDDPLGRAITARDESVRADHRKWHDWVMRLSDWMKAKTRPGEDYNCRCNLEIIEAGDYTGAIHKNIPF